VEPIELNRTGPWLLDWSKLTRDGLGGDFVFERVDHILLAFYEDATVTELESQIMDLELIATALWDIEHLQGRSVDLSRLCSEGAETRSSASTVRTVVSGCWD
jgi:hypothetical protein